MDIPIDADTCLTGEVGLTGELRPITRIEQRIAEAEKLGFKRIIVPAFRAVQDNLGKTIKVVTAQKVEDAFKELFG